MGHTRRKHNNPQLKSRTTRSSRGRLLSLSDPAQTSQQLDDQLRQLGLYAAPTLGDGNCLFRALSDQLHGTDSKHGQLRQDICDWIQKHKTRYEPFVDDERGIDTHLQCMRENATYGGHMELSAFAHMAQRNVKVVQPGLVYVIEWEAFASTPPTPVSPVLPDKESDGPDQEDNNSTIYVAYHDWEHFSSIRNLKGPHVGLPRIKERPADAAAASSPVTEEYKPTKDRKKAEKERERERREKKREKAREKSKGKAKAEPNEETEPENEPEKLKIKLKLRLNSNPSSANISESESKPSSQRTGLKLRLPPSRSLSATPSLVSVATSTPPVSQASTVSTLSTTSLSTLSSVSSAATLPTTVTSAPPSTSTSASTSSASASTSQSHPHPRPLTHTSAPHLNEDNLERTGLQRANRSPKRTFEESELDDTHSNSGRVRSRLCGPDREPVDSQVKTRRLQARARERQRSETLDVDMEGASTQRVVSEIQEKDDTVPRGATEELEEEKEVLLSLEGAEADEDDNDNYESDSSSSSRSFSPSLSLGPKTKGKGTPTTSPSISGSPSPSPPLQSTTTATATTPQTPNKSQIPNLPGKASITRKQKREAALAASAASTGRGLLVGESGRPLTRRQRKALGLPKPKTMMPYERRSTGGRVRSSGTGTAGTEDGNKEEWKRNGTGRVDVRGFRELRI